MSRVRAPELRGAGGWIGTGGQDLSLAALRGRVVLLDFWTSCCANCLHVLDELRPLEERFADVLTVVGVHSPKFAHEQDHATVVAAVERYEVHHPVLDDPGLESWSQYAIRAWPTLVVVDPEGYVVHVASGEGHADGLALVVADLVTTHEARGTLRRGGPAWVAPEPSTSELLFPGKAVRLPSGSLLVADTAHHALVETVEHHVVRRLGSGLRGRADGLSPSFAEPQGVCVLPADVAAAVGYDVVVADSANHLLRGLVLATGEVRTVAGTGAQWRVGAASAGVALEVPMSTPWDVAWDGARVVVAMAGIHQLWAFDPVAGVVEVVAGTTGEGLRDGDALRAYLAQPSGLAVVGPRTWFADSETSALRWLEDGVIGTAVGSGLFDFGHRDGAAAGALLQHPLGVTALPDGSLAVSDTYNGAVRRYDPATDEVSTLGTGLAEPSDAVVDGDALLVVESAAHRITRLPLPAEALVVDGARLRTKRPVTEVGAGAVVLRVVFEPPAGQHLDEREGPATRLDVSASPAGRLVAGQGRATGLVRPLELAPGDGVLHVAAMAASCDIGAPHPACHVTQQDWGIPVRVVDGGPVELVLVLRGL